MCWSRVGGRDKCKFFKQPGISWFIVQNVLVFFRTWKKSTWCAKTNQMLTFKKKLSHRVLVLLLLRHSGLSGHFGDTQSLSHCDRGHSCSRAVYTNADLCWQAKVHWAKNLLSYNIWSQALLKETTMSDFMDWNLESEVVEIVCLECLVASFFLQMNIICHFGLCR